MAYSNITSIEVTNFMVYKHAKVMFDDCNIINLKGYNSAGKSSLIKALGVCLTNMFSTQQAKLIRHGEDFFRIVVNFDDGVSIVRDKYANGQSLYEMYKNSELILTTKEGRKLGKVSEVPKDIQDYLGLCLTQLGCLNFQSRQDRLWLIETKGSENYYSLNEILKTEEIARASQMLNTDKNKLGGEIASIEATLNEVNGELERISGVDDRLLMALEEKESYCTGLVSKYKGIKTVYNLAKELQGLHSIPDVQGIDSSRLEEIERISEDSSRLAGIKELPEISRVDDSRLLFIEKITNGAKSLETLKVTPEIPLLGIERLSCIYSIADMSKKLESGEKIQVPEFDTIDNSMVSPINRICDILEQLNKAIESKKGTDADLKSAMSEMSTVVELAKSQGKKFVQCDNCGSYMEVSVV